MPLFRSVSETTMHVTTTAATVISPFVIYYRTCDGMAQGGAASPG